MNEQAILQRIMLALSDAGHTVFRAQVGQFYTRDGRAVRTGLPVGFSDLFGITADRRPFFIEVKKPGGRIRLEQIRFLDAMRDAGALAGVAYSVEDAVAILEPSVA